MVSLLRSAALLCRRADSDAEPPPSHCGPGGDDTHVKMVRPERFELPTTWFVARYSIQLSYGRKI